MAQRVTIVKVLLAAILTFIFLTNDVAANNDTIEEIPFDVIPGNETLTDDVDKGLGHCTKLRAICKWSHQVRFYAGYGCYSCTMGSMYVKSKYKGKYCTGINISGWACFDNNKARSMLIRTSFPKGGVIYVCDDPDNCWKDDYAIINVKRKLTRHYCVKTFERSYQDSYVKVYYRRVNGLNGRVSRVAACSP